MLISVDDYKHIREYHKLATPALREIAYDALNSASDSYLSKRIESCTCPYDYLNILQIWSDTFDITLSAKLDHLSNVFSTQMPIDEIFRLLAEIKCSIKQKRTYCAKEVL